MKRKQSVIIILPKEVIQENVEGEIDAEVNKESDEEDNDEEIVDDFDNCFDVQCKNVMLEVLAVRGANPDNYRTLKVELQNEYNLDNNQYSEMLTAATRVLQNYVRSKGA